MSNGKGDIRRPAQIPEEELARRWAETFPFPAPSTQNEILNDRLERERSK